MFSKKKPNDMALRSTTNPGETNTAGSGGKPGGGHLKGRKTFNFRKRRRVAETCR